MDWYLTVIDPATHRVFFAGNSRDQAEIEAVAKEARRLRPHSQILIRPPIGAAWEYP